MREIKTLVGRKFTAKCCDLIMSQHVGEPIGNHVGDCVGERVGKPVGERVGKRVGKRVDKRVGKRVGEAELAPRRWLKRTPCGMQTLRTTLVITYDYGRVSGVGEAV